MTLILCILLACIAHSLQCLLNYKVSPDFSNTYWIVSSEELKTLDVPIEKITKAHFDLLQMVKI